MFLRGSRALAIFILSLTVATYLSNYLSGPRRVNTAGAQHFPVIRRISPGGPNYRASNAIPTSAPFSGQDLASALLYQKQVSQASTPSSDFTDNFNYDPILTQIQALGSQSVANAQTNAAQLRNQAGIQEGDPELLRSLGFDENTISAAANNPQSLFATLQVDYANRQKQLADAMQAQNLYYSGEYQKNLEDLSKGYASEQSSIGQKLRDLLSGVDSGVLSAQEAARQADLQNQLDAQTTSQTNNLYSALLDAINQPPAQPSGPAPSYVGPDGNTVTPITYDSVGATPDPVNSGPLLSPITSDMVAPPIMFGGTPTPTLNPNNLSLLEYLGTPAPAPPVVAPSLKTVLGNSRAKLY